MGTGIRIFVEYDYSNLEPQAGYDPAPFEDNVSVWDLEHDAIELGRDEPPISWLTAAELKAALAYASLQMQDLSEPARLIVETIEHLAQRCGTDRVRLIFAFT